MGSHARDKRSGVVSRTASEHYATPGVGGWEISRLISPFATKSDHHAASFGLKCYEASVRRIFNTFGQNINALILRHGIDLERKRWEWLVGPNAPPEYLVSPIVNQKARWVDATPEYSFHVCGLRKLFPKALFIHIVRDVTSVVRSMLNFHRVDGSRLVANEQEAYNYWFRAVSSCLLAERAYGPRVVFRLGIGLVDSRVRPAIITELPRRAILCRVSGTAHKTDQQLQRPR